MSAILSQISQPRTVKSSAGTLEKKAGGNFALEQELLLLCSRIELKPEQINRASFLMSLSPDWNYVLGVAYRNGVLPIVYKNLSQNPAFSIYSEISEEARAFFTTHTAHNIFVTGKLIEAIKMLDSEGIPSLPFKGPLLAMRAYKNIALRHFVDLDLLVQPKDFDRALKLFLEKGYKIYGNLEPKKTSWLFINRKKDIGLISADEKVRIELHWKLSGSFFALPLELKRLWTRLEKMNLGGYQVNTLPFNDLFVYLCLHGARHGYERLNWICDLCVLIQTEKEIDWKAIHDHAQKHGCGKVVELGLLLVYEFFGVKTIYPGWEKIENDKIMQRAVAQIRRKLFAEEFSTTEIGDWYLYHLMLKEKKNDRLKLHLHYIFWYLKIALKPNEMDKSIFQLPRALHPLYYVLRPSRLLFNYFSGKSAKN
jgi:hypothetical protein